ncbi:MAG: LamG domain-containing protein [Patescibacteria group bacterium]
MKKTSFDSSPLFMMYGFFFLIGVVFFLLGVPSVRALNSHSVDLEQSSSQYLVISDAAQSGLDLSGSFTLEAWVKLEQLPSAGGALTLINKMTSSDKGYRWFLDTGTFENKMTIIYWDSTGNDTRKYSTNTVVSSGDIGQWVHLAVVVNPTTQAVSMYKNGSSISVSTNSSGASSLATNSENFSIGAVNTDTTPAWFFDGLIDDVRVWNVTRTDTEVADDMSRELNGNENGLVGYWKLNNNANDSTGSNNNLTATGSPSYSVSAPFAEFNELLKVRKSVNESVINSTVLQNDDNLVLSLSANKTYIIDGVIFASSTSATPDILIGFFGQTDVDIALGYTNDVNEMVLVSGEESNRINLPADVPTSIHIKGTVKTSSTSGDFQLKWAQATSNGNATTIMKGSYLRAEEI